MCGSALSLSPPQYTLSPPQQSRRPLTLTLALSSLPSTSAAMPPPLLLPFHLLLALSNLCSTPPGDPCPPFPSSSTPPYPFSTSPGCGYPSFQIRCASPHSLLSINGLPFSLLRYDPNSSSLTLSPRPMPPPSSLDNCSSSLSSPSFTIPSSAISLSGSPFRVSDSSCSRLSVLHLCLEPEQELQETVLVPVQTWPRTGTAGS